MALAKFLFKTILCLLIELYRTFTWINNEEFIFYINSYYTTLKTHTNVSTI